MKSSAGVRFPSGEEMSYNGRIVAGICKTADNRSCTRWTLEKIEGGH